MPREHEVLAEIRFQLKADTELRWSQLNPVLLENEPGWEKDTEKLKIGDGETPWNDLPYFGGSLGNLPDDSALAEHINAALPHPAYDSGPSFELLYQNAKV